MMHSNIYIYLCTIFSPFFSRQSILRTKIRSPIKKGRINSSSKRENCPSLRWWSKILPAKIPAPGEAQLATIQEARAPTRFFLSSYCCPSCLLRVAERRRRSRRGWRCSGRRLSAGRQSTRKLLVFEATGVSNSKAATFLICLFQGAGCWPVGSAPNGPVLLHKSSSLQEGGRASSKCRGLYIRCIPIIVSHSRRFIAAQFIREFASRWMNGVAA